MCKAKLIFAWETGSNLGHISGLVALSRKLAASFGEPVWVLSEEKQREIPAELRGNPIREVSALSSPPDRLRRRPYSYADVLVGQGFGSRLALDASLREWQGLLEEIRPTLVVVDGAPLAQLAAYLFGWKCVQISNGFDAPPSHCPPFGFGMRGKMIDERSQHLMADLDRLVSDVSASLGGSRTASLTGCLRETTRLVARVAEADPYGARDDVTYVGPVAWPGTTKSAVWPVEGADRPSVFAYLRGPGAREIICALVDAGASVLCFCPDGLLGGGDLGPFVRVVCSPVSMAEVFKQAVAVASYGATTLVCQSLLAGLPQLIVPVDVEKWMVARQLVRQGAAVMALAPAELPTAIRRVLNETTAAAAQRIAHRYAGENWEARLWDAVVMAAGFASDGQAPQTMKEFS